MAPIKRLVPSNLISTLISEVKSRPCIWNQEDDNYNDRFHSVFAWRDIAKILDMPEDVIKLKWKNLRDFFKREMRRNTISTPEDYSGRWRHFKAMWFIHQPGNQAHNDTDDNTESYIFLDDVDDAVEPIIKCEPDRVQEEIYLEESDPIPDKRPRYTKDDYEMMYLKSLTPYFSQLEPIRKLVVRSKIQDMLLNEIAAQTASKVKK